MHGLDGGNDRQEHVERFLRREPPRELDATTERFAAKEFHLDGVVLFDLREVVHGHDVLVAERRDRPRLALKARDDLQIGRPPLVQHLERDARPQNAAPHFVNRAEGAPSERHHELVRTQPVTWLERVGSFLNHGLPPLGWSALEDAERLTGRPRFLGPSVGARASFSVPTFARVRSVNKSRASGFRHSSSRGDATAHASPPRCSPEMSLTQRPVDSHVCAPRSDVRARCGCSSGTVEETPSHSVPHPHCHRGVRARRP